MAWAFTRLLDVKQYVKLPDSESKGGNCALFVNTKSRRGKACFVSARAELAELGMPPATARGFSNASNLVSAVADAVRQAVPLVIVGGGDGTIGAAAGLFVGSSSRLCILPLGTGNAFARDIGVPDDLREACEIACHGREVDIDIGRVSDRFFVNIATVGLSTRIAANLNDADKRRFGRFVYLAAAIRALPGLRPFRTRIETENGVEEFDSIQVVIGNGRFHAGPFPILPDASILEGKLSLYALKANSNSDIFKFALYLLGSRHVQLREVHSQHCRRVLLSTTPKRRVTVDGQITLSTPTEFGLVAHGLPVKVGPKFGEQEANLPR